MITFNKEQIYIVTGASSGIGKAVALLLNELGASVIAIARDKERLESMRAESKNPNNIYIEIKDLCELMGGGNRTIANYYNYLVNKYGKLSGMAYCAGIVDILPIQSIDYNHIDNIFTINHHIPLLFIQTFIDTINSSDISIVIVSSVVGVNPASGMMAYSASKAAITQSCKSIANNCKIRINTISPSDINTPMTMNELVKPLVEQRLDSYPFGIGEPNDVANMTIFLLSNKAKYLSGQNYIIDSGGVV